MDFERKAEVGELLVSAGPEVATVVGENEPAPVFNPEAEKPVGPLPSIQPEMDKPDHSALAAWVDDLGDFEEAHAGDQELHDAAQKMRAALSEDLTSQDLAKMHAEVRAEDEQFGFMPDFIVDSAIEAAATEVKPEAEEIEVVRAKNPYLDENDDDGGGGGGGGGGGKPGEGEGDDDAGDGDGADKPDDDKTKAAAKAKTKAAKDASAKKDGAPEKPAPAPPPSKPDKK